MRIAIVSLILVTVAAVFSFADTTPASPAYDWKSLDSAIGSAGVLKDDVCTFTLPRKDLDVMIDGMDVPTAAGIESEFHFYKCSCGKIKVIGQFCCVDYETNDVIDAIRVGTMIEVSSIAPMFNSDKPRVMIVRFQGEGDGLTLAKLLKSGLGWIGEARTATQPTDRK